LPTFSKLAGLAIMMRFSSEGISVIDALGLHLDLVVVDLPVGSDRPQRGDHDIASDPVEGLRLFVEGTVEGKITASALKVEPSWNFTPRRNSKIHFRRVGRVLIPLGGEPGTSLAARSPRTDPT